MGTALDPRSREPRRDALKPPSSSPAPPASSAWRCSRACSSAATATCSASIRADDDGAAEQRLDDVLATLWDDPAPYRARVRARRRRRDARRARPRGREPHGLAEDDRRDRCTAPPRSPSTSPRRGAGDQRRGHARGAWASRARRRRWGVWSASCTSRPPTSAAATQASSASASSTSGQSFRNTYEQTKWEAEHVLAAPTTSRRSSRGRASSWATRDGLDPGLQRPLLAAARLRARALRRRPGSADGARRRRHGRLRRRRARRTCSTAARPACSTSSPAPTPITVGESRAPGPRALRARAAGARPAGRARPRTITARPGDVFLPYFEVETTFDDARARAVLGPAGLRPARLQDCFAALMDYADAARWGQVADTREAAARRVTEAHAAA